MTAPGDKVGFVLDAGEGRLRRLVGTLIATECKDCVLATPLVGEVDLPLPQQCATFDVGEGAPKEIVYTLVKVPRSELVLDLAGWDRAARLEDIPIRLLLKNFYRGSDEGAKVSTDSMLSARSTTLPRPRIAFSAARGEDADDEEEEEDSAVTMMNAFMKSMGNQFQKRGEEPIEPMAELFSTFGMQPPSTQPPSGTQPAGYDSMQGNFMRGMPSTDLGPSWSNPMAAMTDYDKLTERFRAGQAGQGGMPPLPSGPPRAPKQPTGGSGFEKGTGVTAKYEMTMQMTMMTETQVKYQSQSKPEGEERGKPFKRTLMAAMPSECERLTERLGGGQAGQGGMPPLPPGPPRAPNQPTLRDRVEGELEKIVKNYMQETLGVEPGNIWLWMVIEKISGESMAGLHRGHHYISLCLQLSLKGSEAYTVQSLEVLHQVALEGKTRQIGALMLPRQAPIHKEHFGATGEDLGAFVAYQEAMRRVRSKLTDDKKDPAKKGDGKGAKDGA